jgi:hypothetical protein
VKGFLIFLAFAFPVVLASPFFWSLVRMEWGAERIGYVHGKGPARVTQWATLGPKAAWPGWAVVPADAKLTVRANFEAAPGLDAAGYADIDGRIAPREAVQRYQAVLAQAGWTVRTGRFDATSPDIPPKPLHWCIVQAERGPRKLLMSVDIDDSQTVGRMHWAVGKLPFPTGAKDEPCWSA